MFTECEINQNLTKQEIGFLIALIEQVTQRGAFRAQELRDIGTIYERLKEIFNLEKISDQLEEGEV